MNAHRIRKYLEEDHHRTWGFVIYRCTYDSDDDWNKFIERLQHQTRDTLEFYNEADMVDTLSLTIIEGRSTLDGASTSVVREHFKQWAATAPDLEQGEGIGPGQSQRYRYCIQVDEDALESVIDDEDGGFVDLIKKDWEPHTPDAREPTEDPIEGCTLHDVGWMTVDFRDVMVDMHCLLRGLNDWYPEYRRPPIVARA